jgi:hypothetical protein
LCRTKAAAQPPAADNRPLRQRSRKRVNWWRKAMSGGSGVGRTATRSLARVAHASERGGHPRAADSCLDSVRHWCGDEKAEVVGEYGDGRPERTERRISRPAHTYRLGLGGNHRRATDEGSTPVEDSNLGWRSDLGAAFEHQAKLGLVVELIGRPVQLNGGDRRRCGRRRARRRRGSWTGGGCPVSACHDQQRER